jgi:hypothetical protein
MNCDEAFDALTDPRRPDDRELQRHLELCPRCRQMQSVLEPALALFDDPADDSTWTVESAPFLSADAVRLAERRAVELRRQAGAGRFTRTGIVAVVAGAAALFLLSLLTAFGIGVPGDASRNSSPNGAATCLWVARNDADQQTTSSRVVVLSCVACHLPASLP